MTHTATAISVLIAITLMFSASSTLAADYLTPDLRARVEKLKADSATEPTNRTNLQERTRVLWDWTNAYALDGGVIPVNLTAVIAQVNAYDAVSQRAFTTLDDYIFELNLRDEQPGAIGALVADSGPYEANTYVKVTQRYTTGSREIQTGGGFVAARHFMPNYGYWQTTDPQGDNYISISSSNSRVSFVTDTAPIGGMHGAFRGVGNALMFKVASGTLSEGDEVTITYGDTSRGSRGFLMADFSSDRMPLPLYLVFTDGEPLITLPIQPIRVTGTELAGVHGFAPSVVASGEPFSITVRAEDRFFNRARGGHPDWRLYLDGEIFRRLPASDKSITRVSNISLDEPGVYRFSIESTDGRIKGTVNPILVQAEPEHRIYWGDTHGHSGFAEGIGTPERFMVWARDDARLDYVTHSEHDIWLDDHEWEVLRSNVQNYTVEGEFIAYLGYEWTIRNIQGGHHNVLFRTPERRNRVPAQFYPTLSRLYAGLRANADPQDVVVIPHAHQAGDYRLNDPELEPLVEIMSQHGNFEWFGRMYLNHGHQVGFTAASDNHLSQPGYTSPRGGSLAQRGGLGALLARSKTTDALFDAMKSLKAYATSGERIIIDFKVNDTGMGERGPYAEQRRISGRVIGTSPIDTVTLVKNDEEIWRKDFLSNTVDKLSNTEQLLVSFASDSHPANPGDNPRGWRHWRGTLELSNADLKRAEGRDFHNHSVQSLQVDEENPDLIHFSTLSRGDTSSILLQVENVKRSTAIEIVLEETRESGGAPPLYRQPQTIETSTTTLAVRDMVKGQASTRLPVGDYQDSITLRRLITDGEMDVSFEFEDLSHVQGDYYFIRVRQADDSLAWSSPIWIGGYPKR